MAKVNHSLLTTSQHKEINEAIYSADNASVTLKNAPNKTFSECADKYFEVKKMYCQQAHIAVIRVESNVYQKNLRIRQCQRWIILLFKRD